MALRVRAASAGRQVSLKRPGSRGADNRKSRQGPVKPARSFSVSVPWRGIGQSLSGIAVLACCVVLLAALSVGLLYGYRNLTTGEYFSLKTIEIQGNLRLSSREVLEIAHLNVDTGLNSLALSIDDIEAALAANPWVKEVSVKRVLPGNLVVGIREKEPAFWMLNKGTLYYADEFGRLIAPVSPGSFASLPTLEVEPGAEDSAFGLPDLMKSLRESGLPLDMSQISWVRLTAARGMEVYVENSKLKIAIGLEEWLPNLQRLARTLADLKRRGELGEIREIRAQGSNVWVERASEVPSGNV